MINIKKLETERLILRKVEEKDIVELHENLYLDPLIYKYQENLFPITKLQQTKKLVLQWIKNYTENNIYSWVICLKETGAVIGRIDVTEFPDVKKKYSLKYMIGSNFWNNGYATEAAKKVIDYMINIVGAYKIIGECYSNNLASEKVMKKVGMDYIGTEEKLVLGKKVLMKYYRVVSETRTK